MGKPSVKITLRVDVSTGKRVAAAAAAVGKSQAKFIMDAAVAEAERILADAEPTATREA